MAARHRALSCDHLEFATAEDAAALAAAGTVAVLLPVAFYCLAEGRKPPVAAFRARGHADGDCDAIATLAPRPALLCCWR